MSKRLRAVSCKKVNLPTTKRDQPPENGRQSDHYVNELLEEWLDVCGPSTGMELIPEAAKPALCALLRSIARELQMQMEDGNIYAYSRMELFHALNELQKPLLLAEHKPLTMESCDCGTC